MLRRAGTIAFRTAVVAAAYFLAGRLSYHLAPPPGYATAIWPSAGLAMAAAIVWGPAILPGLWLGALGVNLLLHDDPLVAVSIALGVAAQAALGAWIVRRLAGPGNPLDGPRSLLPTLFIGGPFSCLVSASWALATMLASRELAWRDAPFLGATWWAGDTIGILVFVPPILAWAARPAELWRVRRWTLTTLLVACGIVVSSFFVFAQEIETHQAASQFMDRQRPLAEAIHREFTRTADAVADLASFHEASEFVSREEFDTFTAPKLASCRGLVALCWNPMIPDAERRRIEVEAQADRLEGFAFLERADDGSLRTADHRERYVPALYIEPLDKNRDSLGFDLLSEPVRGAAVEAAIDRIRPTVTARIRLLHEKEDAWSVLIMMPVLKRPYPSERIQGLAVGAVRVPNVVDAALERMDRNRFRILIRDLSAPPGDQLLFGTLPETQPELTAKEPLEEMGRRLQIEISPAGEPSPRWSSWFVLAGCLVFTGLISAFVVQSATRQIQVERLVALRTGELANANEELQRSNIELQRFAQVASHDLREPLRAIGSYAQLLDESASSLSPEHRGFLARIIAASQRMQALVDDLLSLARIEGGAAARNRRPLRPLLDHALENLEAAIAASATTFEIGALPEVACDPSQIVQLFQNLVGNAIKFRRAGVPPVVRIGSRRDGDHWEISVQDNGIGISPEHHARIFEMFERLHPRERYGGTGIGLAICRRVVDRHGGRIWLESEPERGSVFRFTLRAEGAPA